ncbi:hypothetical protein A3224_01225 [Microbulbifer thermotolerans]|uniref:Type VI secretion system protein VasD n=1 Tax=Microbulbifer thermotolerans TaxID=252514 RepID=A0A143HR54_MICTH|nr:hypothetical protein A3224_01225 [Microbulbifer thermotolerans]
MSSLPRLLVVCLLVLTVAACQATRRTLNFDTSLELTVRADRDVNPDNDGRASPVVVRVFMLADDRQFAREDFLNLYENAESRLGRDLIGTVVLKEFAPGEERVEKLELTPDVRYIGLLAEFVQYQRADALMLLPITDHSNNEYQVALADTRIDFPEAIAKGRRTKTSTLSRREASRKRGDTVTISSEEYERMQQRLQQMEKVEKSTNVIDK